MLRDDYLFRQIEKLGALVQRMLRKKQERQLEEALGDAYVVLEEVFRTHLSLIRFADSKTLASTLAEPELVRALAKVIETEAEIYEAQGDTQAAADRYLRALELYRESNDNGAAEQDIARLIDRRS